MKYYDLTDEEKELLEAVESGKAKRVKNYAQVKKAIMAAARNTLNKTKNINIRLSEGVLSKLKAKAVEEGIPYQTLVSSVLYKFVQV
ncbi:BrnA antitoxin family protein [Candidatus Gottesmanbacteria bacterium]|nr:BrnA antitoxin family protein [Candidatus Gottesmanbacteria bacterium]